MLITEGDITASSDLWSTLISYINLPVLTSFCFKNKWKVFISNLKAIYKFCTMFVASAVKGSWGKCHFSAIPDVNGDMFKCVSQEYAEKTS